MYTPELAAALLGDSSENTGGISEGSPFEVTHFPFENLEAILFPLCIFVSKWLDPST